MNSKRKRVRRAALDIVIGVVVLVLLAVLLNTVQTNLSVQRQESNSLTKLAMAMRRLTQNAAEASDDLTTYDAFGQSKIDTVAWFLTRNPEYEDAAGFAAQWGLSEFYTLDAKRAGGGESAPDFSDDTLFGELFNGGSAVTVNGMRYYAAAKAEGGYYVGARNFYTEEKKLAKLSSAENALKTIKVGVNGFIFAVDMRTGLIAYHPDQTLVGLDAAESGLDPAIYGTSYDGWLTLRGTKRYVISQQAGDYLLVATIPETEINENNRQMVSLMLVVFAVAMILLISYALILRKDAAEQPKNPDSFLKTKGRLYLDLNIAGKLKNVMLIGLVAVFGLSFYTQTLASLSRQALISDTKLEAVQTILDDNATRVKDLTTEYDEEYTRRAQNIAYTIAKDPTIVDDDALGELSSRAQVKEIYVFDKRGRSIATNTAYNDFVLSTEAGDQSNEFWDVVKGYKDVLVQAAQTNEYGAKMQYVGVKRLDADGGMIELGIRPRRLEHRLKTTELNYVLRRIAVENGGMLFAVDPETGKFISYSTSKYVGRLASEYGLTENALKDEYAGYQTIDGTEYMVTCAESDGMLLYVAVPTSRIYSSRITVALIVTLGGFVAMLLISLLLIFSGKPEEGVTEEEPKPERENRYFKLLTPSGTSRTVQSAASRWAGSRQPWHEMNPEQKLSRMAQVMLSLVALVLVVYMAIAHGHFAKGSVLGYILNLQWERKPSLFSFSYIALIVLEVVVISTIARRLIMAMTQRFGARSETVGRLLDSFIKYGSVIGAVFYSMNFLGMDSTTLMTSAGILTLVVGLGAQSLISDILAGVFIVFEGEFRVGDIVTIGDWRGTVMEIGIRTTKIESAGKDIKIFNNSAISGVVNMTKQHSYAFIDIGIEYGEPLEHVESILNRELPHIKEHLPSIVSGPFYKGVASLGDSSVNIRIVAQCRENDRMQLTRDLNREVKLIFDHNGINIPFPQVVINQPVEHEQATRAEKRQAAEFVEEQKELTKNIQVRDDDN